VWFEAMPVGTTVSDPSQSLFMTSGLVSLTR
jgi:hypothetical protein